MAQTPRDTVGPRERALALVDEISARVLNEIPFDAYACADLIEAALAQAGTEAIIDFLENVDWTMKPGKEIPEWLMH